MPEEWFAVLVSVAESLIIAAYIVLRRYREEHPHIEGEPPGDVVKE